MPGPLTSAADNFPRLHGRPEEDPTVRVSAESGRLREVVRTVRRPGPLRGCTLIQVSGDI